MNKFELMEHLDKDRKAIRDEVNNNPGNINYRKLESIVLDSLYDVVDYLQCTGLIVEVYQ